LFRWELLKAISRNTWQAQLCFGDNMKSSIIQIAVIRRAAGILALFQAAICMQDQASGSPVEKDFVSGGRVEMTLESGDYEVRPSADNRIHIRWNEANRGVAVKLTTNGKSADLRVENTPHDNFHAKIEVPAATDLRIRMTAGNLKVGAIKGDKDIELNAGDLRVSVGNANEWREVDASVTAGDLNAAPFQQKTGGLFRSIQWKGPGKYRLYIHVTAGDVNLQN
jgi:Putative adhesin